MVYPITILLDVANINRSTYYKWLKRKDIITDKMLEDKHIISKIKE